MANYLPSLAPFLLIFVLLSNGYHIAAQQKPTLQYRVEDFSDIDGLSGGRVFSILQDSKVFLWFGR